MSGRLLLAAALSAAIGLGIAGCGDSSGGFKEDDVVKALDLERTDGAYAIGGDVFCRVGEVYTTRDEVTEVAGSGQKDLLIASKEGNVGVRIVRPFAPDCSKDARADLNRLDKPPKE